MSFQHFQDREEAGRQLADQLQAYRGRDAVVLALPRGGLPVGARIAESIDAPLDIVLVRKIGAPGQPELAIGAIVDGPKPYVYLNAEFIRILDVPDSYLESEKARQLEEINRRRKLYFGERQPAPLEDKTVIVVDDGIATGATARAALQAVRDRGAEEVILAAPVAAAQSVEELKKEADKIVTVLTPQDMGAIGFYYRDFHQLDDQTVVEILESRRAAREKNA
jgi:predicted phosphoribosyltransferase